MKATAVGVGNTSCWRTGGCGMSSVPDSKGTGLTDVVFSQWNGEEKSIKSGDGCQTKQTTDIRLRGTQEVQLIHSWDSYVIIILK